MQNNIIAYLTYMSLIFVVAKLWGRVDWSWWVVTAPVWGLMALSILWTAVLQTKQNRMRSDLTGVLDGLRNLIEQAKKKEERAERTIN